MTRPRILEVFSNQSATIVLVVSQAIVALVAFLINLLSASVMAPSGRGELAFALQVSYVLTVCVLLGIERPYVANRVASFRVAITELIVLFRGGLGFCIAIVVVGCTFFALGRSEAGLALLLVGSFAAGNSFARLARTAYIASGTLTIYAISIVGTQIALLAGALLLRSLSVADFTSWLALYAVTSLIVVLVMLSVARRGPGKEFVRGGEYAHVRKEGLRLLPASLGNTAMLRSDRLLLPLLSSSAELGIYIVVATVMELATWPVQNWVDASLNRWRRQSRNGQLSLGRLVLAAIAGLFFLSAVLGGAAFLVVSHWLDDAYSGATGLILPLGVAGVFYGISRVQQGVMIARGLSGSVSAVEVAGMAASVVAYVALIPGLGASGAAVGSICGYAVCCAAGQVALYRGRRSSIVPPRMSDESRAD